MYRDDAGPSGDGQMGEGGGRRRQMGKKRWSKKKN